MIKKIGVLVVTFILTSALCIYLFKLNDYDLFLQLDKIQALQFENPLQAFTEFYDNVQALSNSGDSTFWGFIIDGFQSIGNFLIIPFRFIYYVLVDLFGLLRALMLLIGFNV